MESASRTRIVKTCGCGLAFTAAEWLRLPYVGLVEIGEREYAECRNCPCGSTIAIEVDK